MAEACPSQEQLERMLVDALTGSEAETVERHVASCALCQQALESLTAEDPTDAVTPGATGRDDAQGDAFADRLARVALPSLPYSTQEGQPPGADLTIAFEGETKVPRSSSQLAIPGYEIHAELGRGGMGIVYLATQVKAKRLVALKMILSTAWRRAEDRNRFEIEVEALARLKHPNIVAVYEVGAFEDQPYFSLEYVEGGTLAQALARAESPLSARRTAAMVETMARAVHSAHQCGIVHRDLKPANILLSTEPDADAGTASDDPGWGTVKIADFGLAKHLGGDNGLTQTGQVLGTPSYMAPEQASNGGNVGTPADVFALGAILHELLVGRPPFQADTPWETMMQLVHQPVLPPSHWRKGLPRDLETICLRCLEKEPARRYAGADALAEDLRRYLAGEPIRARRVGELERLWKWARRHPAIAGLSATVLACLLAIAIVASLAAVREARTSEQIRHRLYFSQMNNTEQAWESANVGRMLALLEPYRQDAKRDDLRGFEWYYWWQLAHRAQRSLIGHRDEILALAFAPDGKVLASAGLDNTVMLWDLATRTPPRALTGHSKAVLALAFAPDGKTLVSAGHDRTIHVWDRHTGALKATLDAHDGAIKALAFADVRRLVAAHVDDTTEIWDLDTGRLVKTEQGPSLHSDVTDDHELSLALTARGEELAVGGLDGMILIRSVTPAGTPAEMSPLEAASGFLQARLQSRIGELAPGPPPRWPSSGTNLQAHSCPVRSLAFSADSRLLASSGEDHSIALWEVSVAGKPKKIHVLDGHRGASWSLAFSPNGKTLATGSLDNTVMLWDVVRGTLKTTLKGHANSVMAVAFSPDGKSVASGSSDDTVKLWDVSASEPRTVLTGHVNGIDAIAFSPDGKTLVSASRDSTIKFWDVASGRYRPSIAGRTPTHGGGHPSQVRSVFYTPDGRHLLSGGWDCPIKIWDSTRRELEGELISAEDAKQRVYRMALSSDGKILASGRGDGKILLWDVSARRLRTERSMRTAIRSLAFSPDGAILASGDMEDSIELWDVARGSPLATLGARAKIIDALAFSPDGRMLASGAIDGSITLWDVARRSRIRVISGHSNQVSALVFSRDGKTLFSAGRDNVIKIWDVDGGELKSTLRGHTGNVVALALSADETILASGSLDNSLRLWRAAREDEVKGETK